jgi:hypothetical protein
MMAPLFNRFLYHTSHRKKSRNERAFRALRALGFPLKNIRLSFSKLTGISQPELADRLKISRQNATLHLSGRRRNPTIQRAIAVVYEVPVALFFAEEINAHTNDTGDRRPCL